MQKDQKLLDSNMAAHRALKAKQKKKAQAKALKRKLSEAARLNK